MTGTKAVHLESWARAQGRPFIRFDYTGHGASSGDFLADGSIGQWARDARNILESLTDSPQILVGSSMGGWIALLLARTIPHRIAALVTIAAAPDFTEDSMWNGFDATQKNDLISKGYTELPSDYSDEAYVITRKLIEDGRHNLVLRSPLSLPFPVRMLHGTADSDVELAVALRLLDHADCDDLRLTLVKGADHRFSTPECLALIEQAIAEVIPA
jgi:pimeloyl-ACP methyl ester carboxylesterase